MRHDLPTTFIGKAITHGPHVVTDGRPFCPADDANGLHGEDSKEEVPVSAVVPVLVHPAGFLRRRTGTMRESVCFANWTV